MRLLICTENLSFTKEVKNVTCIPTKGDRIKCFYQPWPTVIDVLYDYEEDTVYACVS